MRTGSLATSQMVALPGGRDRPLRMEILLGRARHPARAVINPGCAGSLLSTRWSAVARVTGRILRARFIEGDELLQEVRCSLTIAPTSFGEMGFGLWNGLHETVDVVLGRDLIERLRVPDNRPSRLRLAYSCSPGTLEIRR